jgi:hypothetical protein
MRILRIELRRSSALWAGILTLLISLGLFYSLSGPWWKGTDGWDQEWGTLALWQRWQLLMAWPLALAIGAWQGRRDHRSAMDELVLSTPKPPWRRVLPVAGAMALGEIAAYLVIFIVGGAQVAGNTDYFPLTWLPVTAVGILSMVAAVLLGMGIGRILPFLITAPALAILAMTGLFILQGTPDDQSSLRGMVSQATALLSPSLGEPHGAFDFVAAKVSLVQALWFLGLAVTGLILFTAMKRKIFALVPAAAALAIALPLFPTTKAGVFSTDQDAAAMVCADGLPRVCVTRMHQDALPTLVGPAREALALLAKTPDAPTAVEEDATTWQQHGPPRPRKPGVVLVNFDDFYFARHIRDSILIGPSTVCTDYETTMAIEAGRTAVVSWFNGSFKEVYASYPESGFPAVVKSTWDSLQALPAADQPARVAELRSRTCPE